MKDPITIDPKFRFRLDRRARWLTLATLLLVGTLVGLLFYLSGASYLPAWFATIVVVLLLLASLSIPRFMRVSPHSVEIHCVMELIKIPLSATASPFGASTASAGTTASTSTSASAASFVSAPPVGAASSSSKTSTKNNTSSAATTPPPSSAPSSSTNSPLSPLRIQKRDVPNGGSPSERPAYKEDK